jgi:hypothetical protein
MGLVMSNCLTIKKITLANFVEEGFANLQYALQ